MNKKLISALLALGLCFGMTGCDKIPGMDKAKNWLDSITDGTILEDKFNQETESSTESSSEAPEASYDLEGAKKLLESRLKGTNADSNEDYDLPKEILFGGETYTLTWSVNVEENVEIVVEADGSVWVDVNEALVEEFPFILTAKITAPDGTSIDANFNRVIKAIERFVPAILTEAPQENVAYKMNAYSVGKGQDLYFAGTTTDYTYYLKTTADYASATDVYAEYVEGSTEEFYLFHKLEGAEGQEVKEYINIVKSGTHINAQLSNEPVALKFSTEYGTFYRNIDGEDCVLTTDGSYGTIGGKLASDLGGEVSPAYLVTQIDRGQVNEEDKLAYEVKTMEVAPMFVGGGDDVALALHGNRFPDVKISWASNSDLLTINRRTMSFADVAETTEVTLTATITIGGKTETKDFTVKVVANNATAILAAAETLGHNKAFGNDVTLTGTMLRFVSTNKDDGTYSEQYESITFMMSVEGKEVEGYRMKGLTTEAKDAKPGDILTCKGELLKYNSTLEFSFGTIISRVEGEAPETPEAPEGSAILSFADSANRTTLTDDVQIWEQNGVKVTNNKGASTANIADYTNPVRFYKNTQLIVEFAGMQKIEFTCDNTQKASSTELKNSIPATEGVIVTVTDNIVKVVFTAPVDSFTIEAIANQIRISSIAVYTSVSDDELSGEVTPPEGGEEGGEVSGVTLVEGQAYTMYLNQVSLGKELYLTGEMSSKWYATSESKADAADVYAEVADGGYKLYILAEDGAKSYFTLQEYQKDNGHWGANVSFSAEGTVFSYNEAGCWAATLTNDTFFLGTYKDYNTISASASSFMKAELMGVEQFPALLVEAIPSEGGEEGGEVTPPEGGEEGGEVSGVTLVEGQAYTMYLNQVTLGKELYLTGEVSGTWLATSENKADAADVYAEAANGGYKLYVLAADGAKSYINLEEYQKNNGYWGAHISFAAEGTVFSYNEAGCWAATLTNDTFFLGTYKDYNTISASASSFMKAENMGVNQFPALLVEAEVGGETPDTPENPDTHEHNFVDGKCECGEVDPNYTPEGGETPEEPEHQHNYSAQVTAPTCTTEGYTTYTCACGDTYTDNTVASAGHSFVEGICGVCGEVDPNYVPEHQHSYTGVVTEPTCTEDGFTTYTCGECGDKYTDNVVTALGHSYTDNVCGVCGAEQYKTLTIAEAIELGNTYAKDKYSSEMYYVTGKIIEVQQDYYGNVVISDGEAEILVYGIKSEDGSVQYGNFTTTKPIVGDTIKVLSVVGKYSAAQLKEARLISITFATDAEKVAIEKAALTLEDDVLGAKDINLAVAGSIRNDVIITWAVTEGADIAVIENGVLKISNPAAETTVKVVATLACNDESATAEFSIVVSHLAEGAAQPYEATLDFSTTSNRTVFTTSQQVWVQNGIKLINDKGSSTSSVADYANPARFYKSSKITVECVGMTEIVFTANSSSYASALKSSITADANYNVSVSGSNVTVTFVTPVDSFVIASLSGGQVRMNSMLVKGVK